ncbi:MAG: creatininase family protein [Armatimonadetes bacterium]|nr:creatininase family protein [Armatimonadota bacterium]
MAKVPYLYEHLTWEEINDAVRANRCALIPAATIEDHGPHLPVDADIVIVSAICERAAQLAPEEIVLLPCVRVGYSPHHIDFPGTLTIRWTTFVEYVLDITRSLAHHGFRKIFIVNGHGSNRPVLEMAARLTMVERPDVHCAFISWWDLHDVREAFNNIRESRVTSHACEAETSVYLAVDETRVKMDRAAPDMTYQMSSHFWGDLLGRKPNPSFKNPVWMTEYWSMDTQNGVKGDPSVATAEKGRRIIEAGARELAEIVRELRARPIRERMPHQVTPSRPLWIAKT